MVTTTQIAKEREKQGVTTILVDYKGGKKRGKKRSGSKS